MLARSIRKASSLISLIAGLASGSVLACEYSVAEFVVVDLEVRELTIAGMEERLSFLLSDAGGEQAYAQDANVQSAIKAAYAAQGCHPLGHHQFAAKNAEQIADYYVNNQLAAGVLNDITDRFEAVSAQLSQFQ